MKKLLMVSILLLACSAFSEAQVKKTGTKKSKPVAKKVAIQQPSVNFEEIIAASTPVIDKTINGSVNWTEQYIEAKGSSVIDAERFKNPAQANAMAARGAVVVAQRNLLEIINGVNVSGETTVEDMITTSDVISTKVEGIIKGAQVIGEPVLKNGMVEVTMRVPLYQSGGLAPAVIDGVEALNPEVVEPVDEKPETVSATNAAEQTQKFAFNMNGKKFDPSLFPIITDKDGKVLLDLSKVYDPKSGNFPKYLQLTKDVMKGVGFDKGVQFLDVLETSTGKITLSDIGKNKINWQKIGKTAATIGKFLLLLI